MKNRFDLEQEMLQCWNITTDLQTVLEITDDIQYVDAADHDRIQNIIIGMRVMYEHRFDLMFSTFTELINDKVIV